jgi:hypothetical protein
MDSSSIGFGYTVLWVNNNTNSQEGAPVYVRSPKERSGICHSRIGLFFFNLIGFCSGKEP